MAHGLLWIESMVTALLWMTAAYTISARITGVRRFAMRVAGAGVPLGLGALVTAGSIWLMTVPKVSGHYLPATLAWLIGVGIGAVVIHRRALRSVAPPVSTTVTMETVAARSAASGWSPAFALAAFGAALGLTLMTFWTLDAQVRSQLALLRAESTALALAVAPERVPDGENAALVYEDAMAAMVPWDRDDTSSDNFDRWTDPNTAADLDFAAEEQLPAFLASQRPALDLLRRGAAMPRCFFERGYAQPDFNLVLPNIMETMHLARLLALETRYAVATGDADQAVANVIALRGFSAHISVDPMLISLLVSVAIRKHSFELLDDVLAMPALNEDHLTRLADMPPVSARRHLQRATQMEEAFGLGVLSDIGSGRIQNPGDLIGGYPNSLFMRTLWSLGAPLWRVFLLPDDLRGYRNVMTAHRTTSAYPAWSDSGQHQFKQLKEMEEELIASPPGILTAVLLPSLSNLHKSSADLDAIDRLERLAIATVIWQRANREANPATPATLAAVCNDRLPAVPRDPHSGSALRMVVRDSGAVALYSVGKDGIDNGGTALAPGQFESDGTDLVIELSVP